jgi:hypothetical protein
MMTLKALNKARRLALDAHNLDLHKHKLPKSSLLTIHNDKLRGAHHKKVYVDKNHFIDKFTLVTVKNKAGIEVSIVKKHKDY